MAPICGQCCAKCGVLQRENVAARKWPDKDWQIENLTVQRDRLKEKVELQEKHITDLKTAIEKLYSAKARQQEEYEAQRLMLIGCRISNGMAAGYANKLHRRLTAALHISKKKMKGNMREVYHGKAWIAGRRLKREDVMRNKKGQIVSKRRSDKTKARFEHCFAGKWSKAVKVAREELGIKGFCPVGGKSYAGIRLHSKVKEVLARDA